MNYPDADWHINQAYESAMDVLRHLLRGKDMEQKLAAIRQLDDNMVCRMCADVRISDEDKETCEAAGIVKKERGLDPDC